MATALASATVSSGDARADVAVPAGTTVSGLLAMLHIDTADADLAVTLADGRPADLGAAIGRDLPSGVLLAVTGARASQRAEVEARRSSEAAWSADALGPAMALVFSAALGVGLQALPLLGWAEVEPLVRGAGAMLGLATGVPLVVRPLAARPVGAVGVPAVLGLAALALVPPGLPGAGSLAVVVWLAAAFLVAGISWLVRRGPVAAAGAAVWGWTSLAGTALALVGPPLPTAAALLAALGTIVVSVVPALAVRVPETQLLDLPLLTTSASAVRSPELPPPSRITGRRVARTLADATGIAETVAIGGVALSVAMAPLAAPLLEAGGVSGAAAWVAVVAQVLALALTPRAQRSRLLRTAPRLGAAAVAALIVSRLAGGGTMPLPVLVGGLVVLALGVWLLGLPAERRQPSALLGRLAEIGQSLALLSLVPATVLGSGLFDLIRQAAS